MILDQQDDDIIFDGLMKKLELQNTVAIKESENILGKGLYKNIPICLPNEDTKKIDTWMRRINKQILHVTTLRYGNINENDVECRM